MSPIFGVKEQKCLTGYKRTNKAPESQFPKLSTLSESVEPLSRNRDPQMTTNLHVCTICLRPEVVYDVISGRNLKTLYGHLLVNLELASSNSFRDIKNPFRDDVGGGGHRR